MQRIQRLTSAYRLISGDLIARLGITKFQKLHPPAVPKCTKNNDIAKVWTDGSCRFNGLSNASSGLGVYWDEDHPNNQSEKVDGNQESNRAELAAAVRAIDQAEALGFRAIRIQTDSTFVIMAITKQLDFKKPAYEKYRDLIEKLDQLREEIAISVEYVKAHSGNHGNEQAHRLAFSAASNPNKDDGNKLAESVAKLNKTHKKKATKKQSKAQEKENEVEDGSGNK